MQPRVENHWVGPSKVGVICSGESKAELAQESAGLVAPAPLVGWVGEGRPAAVQAEGIAA